MNLRVPKTKQINPKGWTSKGSKIVNDEIYEGKIPRRLFRGPPNLNQGTESLQFFLNDRICQYLKVKQYRAMFISPPWEIWLNQWRSAYCKAIQLLNEEIKLLIKSLFRLIHPWIYISEDLPFIIHKGRYRYLNKPLSLPEEFINQLSISWNWSFLSWGWGWCSELTS